MGQRDAAEWGFWVCALCASGSRWDKKEGRNKVSWIGEQYLYQHWLLVCALCASATKWDKKEGRNKVSWIGEQYLNKHRLLVCVLCASETKWAKEMMWYGFFGCAPCAPQN